MLEAGYHEGRMQSREDIQRAHDILQAVVRDEIPGLTLSPEARLIIETSLDVLCWLLQHESNPSFAARLALVEKQVDQLGYGFAWRTGASQAVN